MSWYCGNQPPLVHFWQLLLHGYLDEVSPVPYQVQQHSQGIPCPLRVLQDLREGLADERGGAVQLHVTPDEHEPCGEHRGNLEPVVPSAGLALQLTHSAVTHQKEGLPRTAALWAGLWSIPLNGGQSLTLQSPPFLESILCSRCAMLFVVVVAQETASTSPLCCEQSQGKDVLGPLGLFPGLATISRNDVFCFPEVHLCLYMLRDRGRCAESWGPLEVLLQL